MAAHLSLLLIVVIQFANSDAHKILTYAQQFGQSHVFFMGGISDTLAEAGHDVTYLQAELVPHVQNKGTVLAKVLLRPRDFTINMSNILHQNDIWNSAFTLTDTIKQFQLWSELLTSSCYHMLRDDKLMEQLKAEKFDLFIGEHFDACSFGLVKRLGIKKYISAFAVPIYSSALTALGHTTTSAFIPVADAKHGGQMSYVERAANFARSFVGGLLVRHLFANKMAATVNAALSLSSDYNVYYDLAPGSSYYFVNSNEHLDFVQPLSPKVMNIGGLRMQKAKPLNADFSEIYNSSARGVVLVSFGTVAKASHMNNETKNEFVKFFSNFPDITFIFKYETPDDGTLPQMENVKLREWIPQSDLLANERTIAFISHSGFNSLGEAAQRGTPLILIPLFADQQRNSQMARDRGIARVIQRDELSAQRLTDDLRLLIAPDSAYQKKSRELGAMITNQPFSAKDRVLRYVDHAIRFDVATNLDLRSRHLSTIEFYCLDVLFPTLLVLFAMMWISWRALVVTYRLISRTQVEKTKVA
ncbi:UDP-glucuronosyltransferase [Aphelenchoides besseyi]|nr:UDP-glucuronosyltransferase [Aphelenchoides besseyi]KAI6202468.1 UDP-glucuronosyltransferase [Aphelenchoides besseyi]